MDDTIQYIFIFIFISAIFFLIAELFGRSKHIGRGWFFLLLMGGLIPGLIALFTSPSANEKPTKGTIYHSIAGWFFLIILGFIGLVAAAMSFIVAFQKSFGPPVAFIFLGIYLIYLGKGKIVNKNPKFYFYVNPVNNTVTQNNEVISSQNIVSNPVNPNANFDHQNTYNRKSPATSNNDENSDFVTERKTPDIVNEQVKTNPVIEVVKSDIVSDDEESLAKQKQMLDDLKNNNILSESEYLAKISLFQKKLNSYQAQKDKDQIEKILNERIQPYLNQLSELTNANILTQEEYGQKKHELIIKYTKIIRNEIFPESIYEIESVEYNKDEIINKVKRLRKKFSLTTADIIEIHNLFDQFILLNDAYLENINFFKNKYGFDLIAEVSTIANSYASTKEILQPLINAHILIDKFPYSIIEVQSDFENVNVSDLTEVEIMFVNRLKKLSNKGDLILKSKTTKIIDIYSKNDVNNIVSNGESKNDFIEIINS